MHPLGARTREDMKERIMDRTQYTNLAKAWEFTEEHARERESDALTDTRTAADESGQLQGSAAQARLLGMLVRITGAASVIAVGTGSLVETLQLAHALDNKGLLTAVDSTAQGIALIRKAFAELQDETDTTLRAVNAPASVFLPRLNANDYDLIVVAGDAENYAATFAQASRLLRVHGVIVFTDVLALEDGQGGVINPADRSDKAIAMRELLTTVEDDEGFESTLTPDGTGLFITQTAGTFQQTGMQIEYITWISLTSRRTLQQQGQGSIGHCMLGQVIIYDQYILTSVHKELCQCGS